MKIHDTDLLLEELEQYKKERERIKTIIGQIGGKESRKKSLVFNLIFFIFIFLLFFLDIIHYLFEVKFFLPPLFSITLGILLISCKIMWMMYKQTKVEHFQFWILNSIEFRLNDLAKKMNSLYKQDTCGKKTLK